MEQKPLIKAWEDSGSFYDLYNQGFFSKNSLTFKDQKEKKELWQKFGHEIILLSKNIIRLSKSIDLKTLEDLETKRKVYTFYLRQAFLEEYKAVERVLKFKETVKKAQDNNFIDPQIGWEYEATIGREVVLSKSGKRITLALRNSYEVLEELGYKLDNSLVHILIVGLFEEEKEDLQSLSLDIQIKNKKL